MLFELGLDVNALLPVFLVTDHDFEVGVEFFVVTEGFHQLLDTSLVVSKLWTDDCVDVCDLIDVQKVAPL